MQERSRWDRWFQHSYHLRLDTNFSSMTTLLGTPSELYRSMAPTCPTPRTAKDWGRLRAQFQSTVQARLLQARAPPAEHRIWHKCRRWYLNLPDHAHITSLFPVRQRTENWHGRAALHHLRQLNKVVTPRVQSAVFSTMWNRWTTARRFQRHQACLLCRGPHTQDAIEHYAKCPVVKRLAAQFLHLDPGQFVNLHFFSLGESAGQHKGNPHDHRPSGLCDVQVHQLPTTRPDPLPTEALFDAMTQWAREGVRGHGPSTRVLARRWVPAAPHQLPRVP